MVPTMSISMPNAAFKFTSIDEVVEKRCNEDFLIDFIGFIVGVCQETDIGSHGERMKVITLEVVLDGKKKIQCNVIGRSCEVFDLSMLRKYQRPPVVVLKPFKIKVLGEYVCLQNVINISRVLINPDMYESVEFLSRFNVACYEFSRFIPIVSGYLIASVGDGFVDWRAVWSIDQLKKNCEDGIFYVLGTVTEVVDDPN
ncbi:Replication factor-A carboxy-terminal domain protein [Arachis hypogaea]|nr:Replication factor-A carboxy-terminal domain protein [Arachis hypogaea]